MDKRLRASGSDNIHYVLLNKNRLMRSYDDMLIKECRRYFPGVKAPTRMGGSLMESVDLSSPISPTESKFGFNESGNLPPKKVKSISNE